MGTDPPPPPPRTLLSGLANGTIIINLLLTLPTTSTVHTNANCNFDRDYSQSNFDRDYSQTPRNTTTHGPARHKSQTQNSQRRCRRWSRRRACAAPWPGAVFCNRCDARPEPEPSLRSATPPLRHRQPTRLLRRTRSHQLAIRHQQRTSRDRRDRTPRWLCTLDVDRRGQGGPGSGCHLDTGPRHGDHHRRNRQCDRLMDRTDMRVPLHRFR